MRNIRYTTLRIQCECGGVMQSVDTVYLACVNPSCQEYLIFYERPYVVLEKSKLNAFVMEEKHRLRMSLYKGSNAL